MISSGNFHADRTALRLDYCSVLKEAIVEPLVRKGKEGVSDAIGVMNDYAFKRDDLDALIDLTKFKTKAQWAEDRYKAVPTAVKTAFTRAFNSQGIKAKNGAVLKDAKVSKKRKAAGGGGDGDGEDDGGLNLDDGVMAVDEEDEDDVDASALAHKLGKKGVSLELKAETGAKKKKAGAGAAKKKPAKKPKAN
jgi:replication factor C subunit 1